MPILERDFIFEEVGDFILEQGLSDGVKLLQRDPDFLLCLNVYRIQLESNYFIDNLLHYLGTTGFPPHLLSLKFDDACRFVGLDRLKHIIIQLHAHKILAVIGEFGNGSNSFEFLHSEPMDAVSINPGYTRAIDTDERARNTLDHLTQIAAGYVKHINVKGIDTRALHDAARRLPVTTMQGEFFSKPLSFDALVTRYYSDGAQ